MRRHSRQQRATRPLLLLEVGLTLAAVLAFVFLSEPGQVNRWGTALLVLVPVVSAVRHLTLYRHLDEYERSLMLRAAACAFLTVMLLLGGAALLGAASTPENVPPLAVLGISLTGWVVFGLGYAVLQRREAQA